MSKEKMRYEDAVEIVRNFPRTWYAGLFMEFCFALLSANVFKPGAAAKLIEDIEKKFRDAS